MSSRPQLSSAARAFLRRQAHPLKPTVQVGNRGSSEAIYAALDQALADHELVKVKVGQGYEGERDALAEELAEATHAAVCQVMGRVLTLYRPHPPGKRRPTSLVLPSR